MESYSLCDSLSGFISKVSLVLTVRDLSEIWGEGRLQSQGGDLSFSTGQSNIGCSL